MVFLGGGLRFGDRDFGERLFLGEVREAELKGLNTFTFFPLCFEVLCFFSPFIFLHLCRQCPHISFFGTDGWFNPNIHREAVSPGDCTDLCSTVDQEVGSFVKIHFNNAFQTDFRKRPDAWQTGKVPAKERRKLFTLSVDPQKRCSH